MTLRKVGILLFLFAFGMLFSTEASSQKVFTKQQFLESVSNLHPAVVNHVDQQFDQFNDAALTELMGIADEKKLVKSSQKAKTFHERLDAWLTSELSAEDLSAVLDQMQTSISKSN